jgi:hypothetical protein
MSIESFVSGLLPSFDSARINEDIEGLREEIKDIVLPMYTLASNVTKGKTLRAQDTDELKTLFMKTFPEYRDKNYFDGIRRIFTNVQKNLDTIEDKLPDLFAKDVTKETITYQKANILQYLTTVRFTIKYAIRSLNRLTANEAALLFDRREQVDSFLAPGELKWLMANRAGYFEALFALDVSPAEFGRTIDSIPQVIVTEKHAGIVNQSIGSKVLDPMRLGFMAPRFNPIYHIRMAIAEWQIRRLKSKQEEKIMLELRLLRLKEAFTGKDDPKLADQISYNEGRLQKLTADIEEFENQYA